MAAADGPGVQRVSVRKVFTDRADRFLDVVAVEEPLEIRLAYSFKGTRRTETAAMTMRTPGHEQELALGFLLAEGVISGQADVVDCRLLGSDAGSNEILVELSEGVDVADWHLRRATVLNSACGLCGKRSMESIPESNSVPPGQWQVKASSILRLPERLSAQQAGFTATGGLHAAALADEDGNIEAVFEDIGRHNALDKLIGFSLRQGRLPLSERIIFMSSRGSFELVQKALAAGCGLLATIGAPSSLAVDFARNRGLTLIGFLRGSHFNVYANEWRVVS
jgi:FdhD protein